MNISIIQMALGNQWENLPAVLKAHYAVENNQDIGYLSVRYPRLLTPWYCMLKAFGALLHKQGENLSTTVNN